MWGPIPLHLSRSRSVRWRIVYEPSCTHPPTGAHKCSKTAAHESARNQNREKGFEMIRSLGTAFGRAKLVSETDRGFEACPLFEHDQCVRERRWVWLTRRAQVRGVQESVDRFLPGGASSGDDFLVLLVGLVQIREGRASAA